MKNKILFGILSLVTAFATVACSDKDDYTINDKALLSDGSVVTNEAQEVTPTSAILSGSVTGLDGQSASSYTTGFKYSQPNDTALTESVAASLDGNNFTATVAGTPGKTITYRAFVTLQGKVTYTGDKKTVVFTDSKAVTDSAYDVTANTAKLTGSAQKVPTSAKVGIIVSSDSTSLAAGNGVRLETTGETFSATAYGLAPSTTYYYASYVDLGTGTVYGKIKQFVTGPQSFSIDDDLVELGVSTKWAKCNIGAAEPTDLGGLFGYGDLKGYNTSIDPADYAVGSINQTAYDVANKVWNGSVTIPTAEEFEELFTCCQVEWTTQNGVAGYLIHGVKGSAYESNSIFLPAAGSRTQATTTGVGSEGRYLSGTVNPSDANFDMSFLFTSSGHSTATTPVYQALSVRPVSTAKNVKFNKELLYKTWEIDLTDDGQIKTFVGPTYFYGSDDCWRTISNHEPIVGDSWAWEADYPGNAWAIGGDAKNCRGSITFNADGTCIVNHKTADGQETNESGTYTIDENNKTISLQGCTMLAPANFVAGYTSNLTTDLRILSLTDNSLQIGVLRDASQGSAILSINMVPQSEKYGYECTMMCMCDWANWDTASITVEGGKTGTYTITYNTTEPRTSGMVFDVDINGFATAYPNAFVRVDAIQADGVDVPFDANKFCYGDIEGKGNFRLELFNIWGNTGKDSPFDPNGGDKSGSGESALAFSKTFSVTFTIVSLDASLEFNAKQSAVGLNDDWSMPGNWGKENPGAIKVNYNSDTHRYELANTGDVALSLSNATDCDNAAVPNGAVNLVDIVDILNYFPGFTCDLKSVVNDGADVPFTASKIKMGDIEGKGNYRIELHNIWGSGTAADPAFGGVTVVQNNNVVTSLGFNSSSVYTIGNFSKNLFARPW